MFGVCTEMSVRCESLQVKQTGSSIATLQQLGAHGGNFAVTGGGATEVYFAQAIEGSVASKIQSRWVATRSKLSSHFTVSVFLLSAATCGSPSEGTESQRLCAFSIMASAVAYAPLLRPDLCLHPVPWGQSETGHTISLIGWPFKLIGFEQSGSICQ